MWRRIRSRKRDSGSPGKAAARTTTALSALASRSTAALARSLSLQTCAAVKRNKQAEDNAQWRQHSGRDCLKCTRSLALREGRDEPVDSGRQQVREAENNQSHPIDWQIVQPVAHI